MNHEMLVCRIIFKFEYIIKMLSFIVLFKMHESEPDLVIQREGLKTQNIPSRQQHHLHAPPNHGLESNDINYETVLKAINILLQCHLCLTMGVDSFPEQVLGRCAAQIPSLECSRSQRFDGGGIGLEE